MSEDKDLGIKLDSSIKKLLKEKYPDLNIRNPAIKAFAICALKYLEEIVQVSADVCLEKDKDTMKNEHVYEALERKHLTSILDETKTIGNDIEDALKKRKESWKTPKEPKKTDEERRLEADRIRDYVKIELMKKKQAEAALKSES